MGSDSSLFVLNMRRMLRLIVTFGACVLSAWRSQMASAFVQDVAFSRSRLFAQPKMALWASGYVPPAPENFPTTKKMNLFPKVGDIVRYYDIDGGKADGQVLVGKISFIQKNLGKEGSGWLVELTELDDVGDGYFAEYPARVRNSRKTMRDLSFVSPIAASFVRSENAFKIPREAGTGRPMVRQEMYDIEAYEGPFSGPDAVNKEIVESDYIIYSALKGKLLKYAAIAGVVGTLVADLVKGTEDALIYASGSLASLIYLFLLSVKTDTLASPESKFGSNIANLRFAMPVLLMAGIAFYNRSLGEASPVSGMGMFDSITAEQFAAATIGFLTYRLPLFLVQLQEAFKDEGGIKLPGSAGVAMELVAGAKNEVMSTDLPDTSLSTVFLVSGPQATGRSALVKRLIEVGNGKFAEPKKLDRIKNGAVFERLEQRGELLALDPTGRYAITKQGIIDAAKECGPDSVVIVDADVALSKQLVNVAGLRIVGVWVGLSSVKQFEDRLDVLIDEGKISVPADETRDSVIRAKIREIVKEIEFGISSGIFEFTVLNDNEEESIQQLRDASKYCF